MYASFWPVTMTTGLAVLSIVGALSIDNQLTPLLSDCFERLAIGERLNSDKVYKTFKHNTVADCKKACSEQKNSCKAFAFGISAKGNATCELSIGAIKETADLKPIGTVADTDFDLYIKKLDCTLVIDKSSHHKPSDPTYQPSPKPVTLGNIRPDDEIFLKPLQNTFDGHVSPDKPPHAPDLSHHYVTVSDRNPYGATKPGRPSHPPDLSHRYRPSAHKDGIHNVQTLVSVASGPQTVLNPVHGILVAGDSSGGYEGQHADKLPPFRPEALDYPYDDHKTRPRPDDFERPGPDYDIRPVHESSGEYGHGGSFQRPYGPVQRPDLDRYDILKPESTDYYSDRYGDRPSRIPFRPQSGYFDSDRPLPDKYGSLIPHPDAYNKRPSTQSAYLFEHEHQHQEYHSEYFHQSVEDDPNYHYHYHRPSRPSQDYDDRRRPPGGNSVNGEGYRKPQYDDNRPFGDDHDSYHYDRPTALAQTYDEGRPKPRPSQITSEGYGPPRNPNRPSNRPYQDERPVKPRPESYVHATEPNGSYNDERPSRPSSKPLEGYGGESTSPESYRPSVTRPYADSGPDVDRPDSYKPYKDSRPSVNRPQSNRPYENSGETSNRPYGDSRPYSNRPFEDSRPQSNNPYEDSKPHNRPNDDSRPHSSNPYEDPKPHNNRPYEDSRPQSDRPFHDSRPHSNRPYKDSRPPSDSAPYDEKTNRPKPVGNGLSSYHGGDNRNPSEGEKGSRPIVSHSTGYNGEEITSIITEISDDIGALDKKTFPAGWK